MSEEKNPSVSEEMLRRLKAIGADLWGNLPAAAAAVEKEETSGEPLNPDIEEAWRQRFGAGRDAAGSTAASFAAPAKPAAQAKFPASARPAAQASSAAQAGSAAQATSAAQAGKPAVVAEKKPVTLENLWTTADESVDWTDALLYASPRDGLTGQKLWSFYHRMAPRVLAGETEAYAEVLTTVNPLGDLAEYAAGMVLRTPDAERVECVFECLEEHLEERGEAYLGALSLRIARDLMAILPVSEVSVTGNLGGERILQVTYGRDQLLKKKMGFLNPADFAKECGAEIHLPQ